MSAARDVAPAAGGIVAAFSRGRDRAPTRAPETVLALDERAPAGQTLGLALQQVSIQAIYFMLPGVVAAAFGAGPVEATNYLCLSLLTLAVAALLQGLTRGPVGSGYAIPCIPSVVMLPPLLLAASLGASMAEASLMVALVGVAIMLIAPVIRRVSAVLPTEVMGVVVFLLGASLLPSVMDLLRLDPDRPWAALPQVTVAMGSLALMVIVGVTRWRLAPFAVLLGALLGTAGALLGGLAPPQGLALLEAMPWFAVPSPRLEGGISVDGTLLASFMLCMLAAVAALLGTLVAFQKATDGGWTRPDPGPLRRGVLAHGLAALLAGIGGAMPAAPASAVVGVSIATRTFARSVTFAGAGVLVLLAFSPKAAALFVLVPQPVQAAMLLYVAGFMMAQGCEMAVVRALDTRRTLVAGLGLCAGLAALVAPEYFAAAMPALAAPLVIGGIVGFGANLLTLPLIKREQGFVVDFGPRMSESVIDLGAALGGGWGLRVETVRKIQHALLELADLLAARGGARMTVAATHQEDRVRITIGFAGEALPRPRRRPSAEDLLEGGEALEAAALWLALRETAAHGTRRTAAGEELWMEFED